MDEKAHTTEHIVNVGEQIHTTYPVAERNQMLIDFFAHHNIKIKLIGDCNKPKVIINDDMVISGFVKNKKFIFTSKQFGGEIIYTINLHRIDFYSTTLIEKLINTNNKTKIYRIIDTKTKQFYVKTDGDDAIFAFDDSRYYFNIEKANKTKVYLDNVHQLQTEIV